MIKVQDQNDDQNEVCNGLPPLVDSKGIEHSCFSDTQCPIESYCDTFNSKCCPKSIFHFWNLNNQFLKK